MLYVCSRRLRATPLVNHDRKNSVLGNLYYGYLITYSAVSLRWCLNLNKQRLLVIGFSKDSKSQKWGLEISGHSSSIIWWVARCEICVLGFWLLLQLHGFFWKCGFLMRALTSE
ncbi:hypothetical protein Ancab_035298 [Ancistrocladus abbreviatus]